MAERFRPVRLALHFNNPAPLTTISSRWSGQADLTRLSIRYDEQRHRAMEAMFEKAKARLHAGLHSHSDAHTHRQGGRHSH